MSDSDAEITALEETLEKKRVVLAAAQKDFRATADQLRLLVNARSKKQFAGFSFFTTTPQEWREFCSVLWDNGLGSRDLSTICDQAFKELHPLLVSNEFEERANTGVYSILPIIYLDQSNCLQGYYAALLRFSRLHMEAFDTTETVFPILDRDCGEYGSFTFTLFADESSRISRDDTLYPGADAISIIQKRLGH